MNLRDYSRKEFERILINNGYTLIRQKGDHTIWQKDGKPNIALPKHKPNIMICKRLIKENGLDER